MYSIYTIINSLTITPVTYASATCTDRITSIPLASKTGRLEAEEVSLTIVLGRSILISQSLFFLYVSSVTLSIASWYSLRAERVLSGLSIFLVVDAARLRLACDVSMVTVSYGSVSWIALQMGRDGRERWGGE